MPGWELRSKGARMGAQEQGCQDGSSGACPACEAVVLQQPAPGQPCCLFDEPHPQPCIVAVQETGPRGVASPPFFLVHERHEHHRQQQLQEPGIEDRTQQ